MQDTTNKTSDETDEPQAADSGKSTLNKIGVRRPLLAIRRKCVDDCCAGTVKYANDCNITDCELWPYRMGRNYRTRKAMLEDMERCRNLR